MLENPLQVTSRVVVETFNTAHRVIYAGIEGQQDLLMEHLDSVYRWYIPRWNAWLELLTLVIPLDTKGISSAFGEFSKAFENFSQELSPESLKSLLEAYKLFSVQWLSFEGELRKYFKTSLDLESADIPYKLWELLLVFEAKKNLKYQTERKFSTELFVSLLPDLVSFRRTSQFYLDLSLVQFFIYPEDLRGFYSAYFLLLNDKEERQQRIAVESFQELEHVRRNLCLYYPLEAYPVLLDYLSFESLPLDREDVKGLIERGERFLSELKEDLLKLFVKAFLSFETNLFSDVMNYVIFKVPFIGDILPKYRFILDTVEIPPQEAQLIIQRVNSSIDMAIEYYNSLFLPSDELKELRGRIVSVLESMKYRVEIAREPSDLDESFSELSRTVLEFNERFSNYSERFREHPYLSYLFELIYRVCTHQAPVSVIDDEIEQIEYAFPEELRAEVEEGQVRLHPFLKLDEREVENYKEVMRLYTELESALENYISIGELESLERVWNGLDSKLEFVEELKGKLAEAQRKFDEFIRKELERRGISAEVQTDLVKQLVYYSVSKDEVILDNIFKGLDNILSRLDEIPSKSLPEELADVNTLKEKTAQIIELLNEYCETGDEELIDKAISVTVSLEPVISHLQIVVMDMLTNLSKQGGSQAGTEHIKHEG